MDTPLLQASCSPPAAIAREEYCSTAPCCTIWLPTAKSDDERSLAKMYLARVSGKTTTASSVYVCEQNEFIWSLLFLHLSELKLLQSFFSSIGQSLGESVTRWPAAWKLQSGAISAVAWRRYFFCAGSSISRSYKVVVVDSPNEFVQLFVQQSQVSRRHSKTIRPRIYVSPMFSQGSVL